MQSALSALASAALMAALAGGASAGEAGPSFHGNPWAKAAEAPGYAKATAHDPRYDDKAVWPRLTGKERFLAQKWPKGRLYVWAHPGEGSVRDRGPGGGGPTHDVLDPRSWLEDGKHPTRLVFDENTDVYFPDAEQPYRVQVSGVFEEHGVSQTFRHITVGRNAHFATGGDGRPRAYHGNFWIQRGGRHGGNGATAFVGGGHVFFRNDNTGTLGVYEYRRDPGTGMTQYFAFNKDAPDASVEVLGHSRAGDEFRLHRGTVILGADSVLQPGRNAVPHIYRDGTLALMDGARFGKWCNQISDCDMELEGTLQGGLPERPLTRDARFGLAYHNHNGTDFYDRHTGPPTHSMRFHNMNRRVAGMLVLEGARVRAFTRDPNQATLVIGWLGLDAKQWEVDATLRRASDEERAQMARKLDGIPKRIAVVFEPGTSVRRVRFDHVRRGGLLLVDPALRSSWRGALFGPHCDAEGDDLFARPEAYNRRARTY